MDWNWKRADFGDRAWELGESLQTHPPSPYVKDSLCHGQFGNAEPLLDASSGLADDQRLALLKAFASEVANRPRGRTPALGVMRVDETPGLMLGLAGIDPFCLWLYDGEKAPPRLTIGV